MLLYDEQTEWTTDGFFLYQMSVQCVKNNCAVLNKNPIKAVFLKHVTKQAEVILKPLSGVTETSYRTVRNTLHVTVSLTVFSPARGKHAWLPRGMELGGLSSDHLQKQLNMSLVSAAGAPGRLNSGHIPRLTGCL